MGATGDYDVLGRVTTSSGSVVWKARDTRLGRDVALKQITAEGSDEVRVLASLSSEHVVRVYGVVADGDRRFLVEEWIDGSTLRAIQRNGRLREDQALGVIRGALLGLADVHRQHLVHGDVSTSNILVDTEGISRLVDFGSAGRVGDTARPSTAAFAAPETLAGQPITPAADVYAAAAVLAAMLHGRNDTRPSTKGVERSVRGVLDRALDLDPGHRYPDAAAFLTALDDAAERDYGAAWWTQAGLGALAAGTSAALVTDVAGAPFGGSATATVPVAAPEPLSPHGGVLARPRPTKNVLIGAGALATVGAVILAIALNRGPDSTADTSLSGRLTTSAAAAAPISTTASAPSTAATSSSPAAPAPLTAKYRAVLTTTVARGKLHRTSYYVVGFTQKRTWTLRIDCAVAPCAVQVNSSSGLKIIFQTAGATWTERTSELGVCSDEVTGKVYGKNRHRFVFRVSAVDPRSGTLPSALHGTLVETIDGASRCGAGRIVRTITATRA